MQRNKCRTAFTLSVLPLATVGFLGLFSTNVRIYAQNSLSVNTPNQSPAANQETQAQKSQVEQQKKLEDISKTLETLSKNYESVGSYQDKLLNTVLLTLMGTVVSITMTFLGYQVFTNVINRSREDKIIQATIEQLLEQRWKKFEYNSATRTERQLNSIEIKLKWIEYSLATLSAEQIDMLDMNEKPDILHYLMREHRRAIEKLQNLQNDNQGRIVGDCIVIELEAINIICQGLTEVEFESNSKLQAEIRELEKTLVSVKNDYKDYTDEIENKIHTLVNA
jgi:hypothetical protein